MCLFHRWTNDLDGNCTAITRLEGFQDSNVDALEPVDDEARVIASETVHQTDAQGQTQLFAVGRYHDDRLRIDGDRPLRCERIVHLQTRLFDNESGGSHLPL